MLIEKYFDLLEGESVMKEACASYEEQKTRRLNIDAMVNEWRDVVEMAQLIESKSISKQARSRSKGTKSTKSSHVSSAPSSNLSIISQKKEEIALAQFKLEQLKIRQSFEEREQELKRSKDLAEAEMEVNRAAVSLEIYQQAEEEKERSSKGDILEDHFTPLKVNQVWSDDVVGPSKYENTNPLSNPVRNTYETEHVMGSPERMHFLNNNPQSTNVLLNSHLLSNKTQPTSKALEDQRQIPFVQQSSMSLPAQTQGKSNPSIATSRVWETYRPIKVDQGIRHAPTTSAYLGPTTAVINNVVPHSRIAKPYSTLWQPPMISEQAPTIPNSSANVDVAQALRQPRKSG